MRIVYLGELEGRRPVGILDQRRPVQSKIVEEDMRNLNIAEDMARG